jgi:hypothetical protein
MKKRFVLPAAAIVVAVLGGAWWLALSRTTAEDEFSAAGKPAGRASAAAQPARSQSAVIATQPQLAPLPPYVPARAARYEMRDAIRDTTDLRAYYERAKDLPDPTGERAYRFAEAIFECTVFMDLPPQDLSSRLALTKAARESPRRQEVFAAMVERCKGFAGNPAGVAELVQQLHRRAEAAEYPAAIARSLRMEAGRRDPEWADKTAVALLTGTPDPDVVHELAQYLNLRTAGNPAYRGIDAAARSVAWGLLECQYGADCGPRSRPLTMTCIAYGACDLTTIEEAVLVQGAQATVNNAIAIRDQLARRIAERDWSAVGLAPRPKTP